MPNTRSNPADAGAAPPRAGTVVGVLAFGGIVVALMQTLVIPLIPELPKLLHASASDTTWAITATLLAAAVATPVVGRLGDMYGKRRMLLVSLILLVAGSAVGGLSDTLAPMIAGRALQGMAAGVIPLGISIMRDELPAERLGAATALMSASLGVGGALGLPAAALMAEHADWHVLFWTSAGLGALVALLVLILVPESAVRSGGRFDLLGAAGLSTALVCLLLAISKGAAWGWAGGRTMGLFAAAAVVLLMWGLWELRARQPLVDLRTTARRQVLLTNVASAVFGFSMFAMSLLLPQILQLPKATGYGLGQSIMASGLVLAPSGLVMMATAPLSARISKTKGPKVTLMLGAVVVAVGYGLNIALMSEVWHLVLASCIIGAGIGLAYGAMPALVMAAVPVSETAAANSLNTLMRSIGTSVSSAVAGVILAQMTTSFGSFALPSKDGFRVVMATGAGAALIAFVFASFLPRRRPLPAVPATTQAAPAAVASAGGDAGPEGHTEIRGFVRTGDAAPVSRATLTLIDLRGRQVGRAAARKDGSYALTASGAGSYVLIAAAGGHEPQAATVVVGDQPLAYDVTMTGTAELAGTVRSAATREPIAEAMVVVTDARGEVLVAGNTGADGGFTFRDLVAGVCTVAVSAGGRRPCALPVEIAGSGTTRIEVELPAAVQVRGTVRAGAEGTPLADARVTLVDAAGNVAGIATTGTDGEYAFTDLGSGAYTVVASGYPPVTAALALNGNDESGFDITLRHADE